MNKKILTVLAAGTVTLAGAGFAAHAADVDPWEAAANEYLAHNADQPKPAEEKLVDKPAAEKPAAEKPAENKQVIDEKYVKDSIDTPTGAEAKAQEDKYLDKAEAKYKEELAKQTDKQATDKKDDKAGNRTTKPAGKTTLKTLPKTSAVR